MKKGGRFERFRDRFLTPWWSRYIVMPAFAALPGAIAALWYGINKDNQQHYYLKDLGPWVIFGAAVWAGIFSAIKSGLNDVAAFTVTELVRSRDGSMKLCSAFQQRQIQEPSFWKSRTLSGKSNRFFRESTRSSRRVLI